MFEILGTLASKIAASLSGRGIDWVLQRLRRPTIHLRRAPGNFFEHVLPGTSLATTREVLGTPHRVHGVWHSFEFSDVLVQIGSADGQSVDWIAAVLPKLDRRARFPLAVGTMGSIVLGKSTLADALALDPEARVERESSSKHWCFWTESFFGFSGMYLHYLFGVIEAPCTSTPGFDWDNESNCLKSDPKTVRLNWIAVSGSQHAATAFNFWAFV